MLQLIVCAVTVKAKFTTSSEISGKEYMTLQFWLTAFIHQTDCLYLILESQSAHTVITFQL